MKNKLSQLLLCLVVATSFFSCDKENDDNNNNTTTNPDAVFNFEVTRNGAAYQTISFTLPEQVVSGPAMNGSYNRTINLFAIAGIENPVWQISFSVQSAGVSLGTYNLSGGNGEQASYANLSDAITGGTTTTEGTLVITNTQAHINGIDWFLDGSLNFTVVNSETVPDTFNIDGTFTGLNIKTN